MPDPITVYWAAVPAPVPLPGAEHHWQLVPCCDTAGTADLLDLPRAVVDDLLTALRVLRDRHGWPGYAWAVQPGRVVVDVAAGGKATMRFDCGPDCQVNHSACPPSTSRTT